MEKTDLLLKMLDSPKDYSEAQWEEILSDQECRELYDAIAKVRGAVEANGQSLTDKEIADEWQRLAGTGNSLGKPNGDRGNIFLKSWQRVAAIAASVVVVSGLAYAAVSTHFFGIAPKPAEPEKAEQVAKPAKAKKERQKEKAMDAAEPKLFDDVALSEILTELAGYYDVEVEYKDEDVKGFRLYFEWNPEESLQEIVSTLNHFESFSIKLEGKKIIISKAKQL